MNENQITKEQKKMYWDGKWNKCVRYYFYLQKGLAFFNELRYVVLVILALYGFMKMDNPLMMPMMFFCFIPPLTIAGYMSVHKMDKIMEFLQVKYATHFSHHNIDLQERQLKILEKIDNKIPDKNSKGEG